MPGLGSRRIGRIENRDSKRYIDSNNKNNNNGLSSKHWRFGYCCFISIEFVRHVFGLGLVVALAWHRTAPGHFESGYQFWELRERHIFRLEIKTNHLQIELAGCMRI